MNSSGVGIILATVLFVGLALTFRLAIRRAQKTGIGSAEGFVTGAGIAGIGMYLLQKPNSSALHRSDQEVLPPLPQRMPESK
jgi:hypothetical protein